MPSKPSADATPGNSEALLPCPGCGAPEQRRRAQTLIASRLRWYESTRCSRCGLCLEADGIGMPPPDVRARLLAAGGRWALRLPQTRSVVRVARVLRDCLALDSSQSVTQARQPGGVLYQGSHTECTWLGAALAQAGEETQLLRQTD